MVPEAMMQRAQAHQEVSGGSSGRHGLPPGRPEPAGHRQRDEQVHEHHLQEIEQQRSLRSGFLGRGRGAQTVMELVEDPSVAEVPPKALEQIGVAGLAKAGVREGVCGNHHHSAPEPGEGKEL